MTDLPTEGGEPQRIRRRVPSGSSRGQSRRGLGLPLPRAELDGNFIAALVVLVAALILGGASRENRSLVMIVELVALAALPFALHRMVGQGSWRGAVAPLVILALAIAVPLAQLIPLPPSIWTGLPGRDLAVSVYEAVGMPIPWAQWSMTPDLTIASALVLIIPAAVFIATLSLTERQQLVCVWVILGCTFLGLLLGLAQFVGGDDSPAYLYATTSRGSVVGLFSNRNHLASLLLCTIPLAAATIAHTMKSVRGNRLLISAFGALILVVFFALLASRSRAGLVLLPPAVLGSAAVLWRAGVFGGIRRWQVLLVGGLLAAATLLLPLLLSVALRRLGEENVAVDPRFLVLPDIWATSLKHAPWGSGIGSFDAIYRSAERTATITPAFMNHAHNDYLEIWFDAGAVGVGVLIAFLAWVGVAIARTWSHQWPVLPLGATVVILLLLGHSVVDYPLRTPAMLAVFAFACGILARPIFGERPVKVRRKVRTID